jgi:type IV fimbrial biogenesis protein FimT
MAGVTLIELLTTLSVAAILTTMAVPSFQNMLSTNRVAGLTNELSAALQLARSEAVKRGRAISLCKSSTVTNASPTCSTSANWQDGWLIFVDYSPTGSTNNGNGTLDINETLLRVGQPASGNSITAGSNFTNSLTYRRTGTISATGDDAARTLSICVAPNKRELLIKKTGQIKITKSTCA